MRRFFTGTYRYLSSHKPLMYTLLVASSVVFVFFGLKLGYEEDISKLLPSTASSESGLAFSNIKVKDKIFVQFSSRGEELDSSTLGDYSEEFCEALAAADTVGGYIADILYRIPDDLPVMALDYAMAHVPCFVDTSAYSAFEELLTAQAVDSLMAIDFDLIMEDMTGSATEMVCTDPLMLRNVLLGSIAGDSPDGLSGISGFSVIDGRLFCRDGTVALAFISPNFGSMNSKVGTLLAKEIEAQIASFEAVHPDVEVLFHGAPVRSVFNSRQIKADLLFTIGGSLLIILIVLCLCFKSVSFIPQNLLPVLYGTFFSLACMYWIKGEMSLMALGIGAIVLGVALSYCLHVLIHHKYVGDPEKMLREEAVPVSLGCITTIGAFMGLLFTESDLLRDFGIFASLALLGSTFFALVFLPHFLKKGDTSRNGRAFEVIEKVNSYPFDRKPVAVGFALLLVVIGFVFAGKVGFDSNLRNIGYNEPDVLRSEVLYAEKNYGGLTQMYYAVASEDLDEALSLTGSVAAVLDSLAEEGKVSSVNKVAAQLFVPQGVQEERIEAWKTYWNPEKVTRVKKLLSSSARSYGFDPSMFTPFYNMISADYPAGNLFESGVFPDGLLANFIELGDEGKYLVFTSALLPQDSKAEVDSAVDGIPHAIVMDPFHYTGNMVSIIHDDFNVTLLISSLFVLVVLLLSFRNLWCSLLAFMPMALSWYVVQGVMALFGVEFNLINIVISTFIFGIGVDYSIFVLSGLLASARGEGQLLGHYKTAIFFSAFVLLVVMLSLLLATHPAIRSIGVSSLIGMTATILFTYILQPLIFRLLLKWGRFRRSIGAR